jgi:hypothetical protein
LDDSGYALSSASIFPAISSTPGIIETVRRTRTVAVVPKERIIWSCARDHSCRRSIGSARCGPRSRSLFVKKHTKCETRDAPRPSRNGGEGKRHPDGAALRLLELTEKRPALLLSMVKEKTQAPYSVKARKRPR